MHCRLQGWQNRDVWTGKGSLSYLANRGPLTFSEVGLLLSASDAQLFSEVCHSFTLLSWSLVPYFFAVIPFPSFVIISAVASHDINHSTEKMLNTPGSDCSSEPQGNGVLG